MSINKILDRDIEDLRQALEEMVEETKIQYAEAFEVLKNNDEQAALMIFEHDRIINAMQNSFTTTALWKISKQNLVARDLRLAVGGILISKEIERVADYSKNIAKFFATYKPTKRYTLSIVKTFGLIMDMLDAISLLFINFEQDNSDVVHSLDEQLSKELEILTSHLFDQMRNTNTEEEANEIGQAIQHITNLERASDHIYNVQEIVTFIRVGEFKEAQEDNQDKNDITK